MFHRSTLLACAVLLASAGCLDSRPVVVPAPIDSRLVLRLHEAFAPDGRTLQLLCQTERIYPTAGYLILDQSAAAGSGFAIEFTGIVAPAIGATMLAPARAQVSLDRPGGGIHALWLSVNRVTATARLTVTPDSFAVERGEGDWTTFPAPVLHRVPPGSIWGWVGWGPDDRSARAEAFLHALALAGARPAQLASGDYEYFQVGPDGRVTMPGSGGTYASRAFVYRFADDPAVLARVVRDFADGMWIAVYDDRGGRALSWVTSRPD